ncbi:MAG TPA: hypothetical protein VK157_06340 [Phycisphaerales bacterium]|nr:hypothetical protein [Phycisphaerales bacterium]
MFKRMLVAVVGLAVSSCALAQSATTFTYQGELRDGATPANGAYDVRFRLFDSAAGTTQLGPTLCVDDVTVDNGKFAVLLDFGAQFSQPGRFLEVAVRAGAASTCTDPAGFTALVPLQPVTSAPAATFATSAATAVSATTAATAVNASQLNGQSASFYTSASNLAAGTLADARLSTNVPRSNVANVFTAANTFSSDVFVAGRLGSATAGVTVMAQNQNVLRFTPAGVVGSTFSPNIAAGSPTNTIDTASIGAAILSGGNTINSNLITGLSNHAVIAGGINNAVNAGVAGSIAGGSSNTVSGAHSAIGGGQSNIVGSQHNTIAGGNNNATSNPFSAVGGGNGNQARGTASVVSGGQSNESLASFAAVPGGQLNVAGGEFSLAAGRRAKVRTPTQVGGGDTNGDEGSFVFADSTDADFTTTGANQFLIRAGGGVGINNATPLAPLHVSAPAGSTLGRLIIAPGIANSNSELFLSENTSTSIGGTLRYEGVLNQIQFLGRASSVDSAPHMTIGRDTGDVGVGTTTPAAKLDVNGTIRTSVGVVFPDGTTQATTALDPGKTGSASGYPAGTTVAITINGVAFANAKLMTGFVFSRPIGGAAGLTERPVFRRPRTSDNTWYNWVDQGTGISGVSIVITVPSGGTMTYTLPGGRANGYRVRVGDDGLPFEEIEYAFAVSGVGTNPAVAVGTFAGLTPPLVSPRLGDVAGTTGALRPAINNVIDVNVTVSEGLQFIAPVDPISGLASGQLGTGTFRLRANALAAGQNFDNWMLANASRNARLVVDAATDFNVINDAAATAVSWGLRVCDDGLPVEEFAATVPMNQ